MKRQNINRSDIRAMDSTGVMDRGAVDFKSRVSHNQGDIMAIASKNIVTLPPTTNIMGTAKTMLKYGFRRVPIADAGTNRLVGIITSLDIVDFLGGGLRHNIVKNRYKGNLAAAINEDVREIMKKDVVSLGVNDNISNAIKTMIEKNIGGIPIVDDDNVVVGIVSERDFVRTVADITTSKSVNKYMSNKVVTASPDISVGEATRTMIEKGFRRIPIVKEDVLLGIVTASDVMRYLGSGEIFQKLMTGDVSDAFKVPLKSLILRDIIWTNSGIDIGEAAALMLKNKVGALPIIDDGELCGILTERDIIKALVD
ncbi:MAG: CBS domain-containing protein [ANME-2 cluster archaeon]|nr:CBS domain-containing protein [ANME-2 cluster archaeon]MBC2701031.1 CBS domain-containing protein [ANME-2 cluster archaeon]MBC2707728.1 CBS domain-containing protein [ANME-2 cluster archaeon]MBC2747386.1 CBS domain-containing protein [ANME-2 cluster archaeon]MBC2762610.1 CBS domain-containing protein [ANME-2 cluster archaeon]